MQEMGIEYIWDNNTIHIKHQSYSNKNLAVENDWSSASFIYSLASLSNESKIEIPYLNKIQFKVILLSANVQSLGCSNFFS